MSRSKKILIVVLTAAACALVAGARYFFPGLPVWVIGVVIAIGIIVVGRLLVEK